MNLPFGGLKLDSFFDSLGWRDVIAYYNGIEFNNPKIPVTHLGLNDDPNLGERFPGPEVHNTWIIRPSKEQLNTLLGASAASALQVNADWELETEEGTKHLRVLKTAIDRGFRWEIHLVPMGIGDVQ